jgi:L-amino acid N-acyltransferase YncA
MPFTSSTLRLRACEESDLPAIRDIAEYYVNNTVITLALNPPTVQDIENSWNASKSQGLPYLVAVDQHEKLLGFCSVGTFRGGGGRAGYRHSVELSLFCHQEYSKRGIGSKLLQQMIDVLKAPEQFPDIISTPRTTENKVRMVFACMSVDETTWKDGMGLRDFYVKHEFAEVGHLKKAGHKFDRWYADNPK